MEKKPEFVAHYHGVSPRGTVVVAWLLFQLNPSNNRYEEIDYGDNVFREPKKAVGNTACFIAAKTFLEHFKKNYPLKSKLCIASCNKIVAKQLSREYDVDSGSYVEYAYDCLNLISELKSLGCKVRSEFNTYNEAKDLANLTKQQFLALEEKRS